MSTASHARPSHLPGLDGLRAVAILMVLAAHVFGIPGGVFGVDLFFALSGFLITRLLLADRTTPTGYFRRFYIRRALRIAPPYYLVVAIVMIASAEAREQWWIFVLYLADFPLAPSRILGHTWSLAIEEQFYLVWPAVIRRVQPRNVLWICAVAVVVSIGIRLAIPHVSVSADVQRYWFSFGLLSRTDGLFVGAAVAILAELTPESLARWWPRTLSIGAAAVCGVVVTHNFSLSLMSPLMAVVGIPAIAIVFGSAVWAAASLPSDGIVQKVLCMRWLRRIGKVSYTIYLVHVPLIALADRSEIHHMLGRRGSHVAAALASYVIAELSWRVMEGPLMRLKARWA